MNRLLLALTVLAAVAVAVVGVMWFLSESDEEPAGGSSAAPEESSFAPAAEALARQGAEELDIVVVARMPNGFNDGVPRRRFTGDGALEEGAAAAVAEFEMSDVPNSAGYFGHVPDSISVIYVDSSFLVTFPILADVLEEPLEWLRYDLDVLAEPAVIELGIGQLRELGLADPRLGLALLASPSATTTTEVVPATAPAITTPTPAATTSVTPGPVTPSGTPTTTSSSAAEADTQTAVTVLPSQALDTAPERLRELFEELVELGVERVELVPELDPAGELTSYSYELEYPPAPDSNGKVRLRVSIEVVEAGATEPVEVPADELVQPYEKELGL